MDPSVDDEDDDDLVLTTPWPTPDRSLQGNLRNGVNAVLAFASGFLDQRSHSLTTDQEMYRTPQARARALADGDYDRFRAAVLGTAPWCPPVPQIGRLTIFAEGVELDLDDDPADDDGTTIPVGELLAVGARPAGQVPTSVRLPTSWWVVDLSGPHGQVCVAAAVEDLAVLGGLAGWTVPPGWPHLV